MTEQRRVYAVLVDVHKKRAGLNIKDSTLPNKLRQFEGLLSLFGGAIEAGETPESALARELEEEIPGFLTPEEVATAYVALEHENFIVYGIATDLSGHRKTRSSDRIGALAAACREGDGVVRSIAFIRSRSIEWFVDPLIKQAINCAFTELSRSKNH